MQSIIKAAPFCYKNHWICVTHQKIIIKKVISCLLYLWLNEDRVKTEDMY